MSQTETKVLPVKQQTSPLNIPELRTVKWIQSVGIVKQTYSVAEDKFKSTKRIPFFYWILSIIEMVFISFFLFIHSIPWPNVILEFIYKVDRFIEKSLEAIANKIEWWWDIFVVRFMWFRDSLESLVDAILSFGLFLVYKIVDMWMWAMSLALRVLQFFLSPVIRVLKAVLPTERKIPKIVLPSMPEDCATEVSANDTSPVAAEPKTANVPQEPEIDEQERYSGSTSSECESDVSVLSETWSIGHTDKFGKYYNRVEMKATAEGRLRAAMYKRVKSQLILMRKNSVRFSRGMTSYLRKTLEPKVVPLITTLKIWLRELITKLRLADAYDRIYEWVEKHYIVSLLVYFAYSAAIIPLNIVNKFILRSKKKSRRTRSMRSESLRRRNAAGNQTQNLEPYGLIKSKEPVVVEEPEYCNLRKLAKASPKSDDDLMRDSALASSIDDLCQNSDSNEGPNYLKEKTIVEEEPKDLWNERVKDCINKTNRSEGISNEEVPPTVTKPQTVEFEAKEREESTMQVKAQEKGYRNSVPNATTDLSQENSREINSVDKEDRSPVNERRHSDSFVPSSPELNLKGVRKDVLASPKLNQRAKNGPVHSSGPLIERDEGIQGSYEDIAKSEENLSSEDSSKTSNGVRTKRKISFSVDSVKSSE